jgi:hypothetical protein
MKLAIVVSRRDDLGLARALTEAALRAGDPVRWFVMSDGVGGLADAVAAMSQRGPEPAQVSDGDPVPGAPFGGEVEVIACATSVDQRGLAMPAWITLGSQDDHAALLSWADRTVALT